MSDPRFHPHKRPRSGYKLRISMRKSPGFFGELALIEQIRRTSAARHGRSIVLGIGDDCAILRPPRGSEVLVTTDFTLEGRHFRRDLHPPESVGHRCLARGLSDLAAMGATPLAAFLSLALPAPMLATASGRAWIDRFMEGLQELAKSSGVTLAGGDTSESPGGKAGSILADIILLGSAPRGKALRRSGGKAGDAIYVTGYLGGSAAELSAMQTRGRIARISKGGEHPQMFPQPRLDTGEALLRRGLATACLDISDGLSTDLAHLCRASGVHAELEQAAIPVHPLAHKLPPDTALRAVLHAGEDYELLFAAPPSLRMPASVAGIQITRIGTLTRRRPGAPLMTLLTPAGAREPLEPMGWEHFSASSKARKKKLR